MEAYIAALYFSYPASERMTVALPIIDAWLRDMYDPLQDFFYNYMSESAPIYTLSSQKLNARVETEYDQYNAAAGADLEGNIILLPASEMSRIDAAAQGMHPLLQMYCTTQERELRYDEEKYDTSLGLLWKMTALVDGIVLGEGTRAIRKVAKNVAAWEAAKKLGLTVSLLSVYEIMRSLGVKADSTSTGSLSFKAM